MMFPERFTAHPRGNRSVRAFPAGKSMGYV